ncbi:MAG: hypothetical protein DRJ66_03495 [Thermoprotei archaeon]|nr:MAG: hypothetical protein DRJ66_03495 [Thermoprotei archaeon]RLF20389.1 MAG: hypothetical protein DRZ82_02380 [Thermoprotei archaeon]
MIERYEDIERLTLFALGKLIKDARGSVVTFTCKKLAKIANLSTKPVTLTLVRAVLEELRKEGYISIYKISSHGIKYMITRESPLWNLYKASQKIPSNVRQVIALLKTDISKVN